MEAHYRRIAVTGGGKRLLSRAMGNRCGWLADGQESTGKSPAMTKKEKKAVKKTNNLA
jgi:hypothetical protein